MNRFFFHCVNVICVLGGCVVAQAQSADGPAPTPVPPPKPPFVAAPRPNTRWELQLQYKPSPLNHASAPDTPNVPLPAHVASIACWRDGAGIGRTVVSWSNGEKSEAISAKGRIYSQDSKTGVVTVLGALDGPDLNSAAFYAGGYHGTSWITLNDYQGVEVIANTPCYKFHRAAIPNSDLYSPEMTAWISVADKLPMRLQLGEALCVYSAVQPWDGTAEVSAQIRAKMAAMSQQDHALEALKHGG